MKLFWTLIVLLPSLLFVTPVQADEDCCKQERGDEESEKKEEDDKPAPPKIGNFSLPVSQQPSALFGFGGNIIDKGEIQMVYFADDFIGKRRTVFDIIPGILFGVTDDFSIFFNFPFTPLYEDGCNRSHGIEDFFVQFEYAFYNNSSYCYVDQATFVFNVGVPTGSINQTPNTGFGSPTFFIGGTYYRTWIDWVAFTSNGALLTTSENGDQIGNQFLYQFGVGRNFATPPGWIFAWVLELDGQYSQKNRFEGILVNNSGGNIIYMTPSIWISTETMIFQFGVSVPINQNLYGQQRKFDYGFNLNFEWSFY